MTTSPIGPCVQIKWTDQVTEYVPLYPGHEQSGRFETFEYWNGTDEWLCYHPRIKTFKKNKKIHHKIDYLAEDHPKYKSHSIFWGTSTIIIDTTNLSVTAKWEDIDDIEEYSGQGTATLIGPNSRARTNASPTIRNQSVLRKLLLATDRICAITGEATETALECAHIVAVKNGGDDVHLNTILLRADLHRLYDDGSFKISPDGRVVNTSNSLSGYYLNTLKDKRLNSEIIQRVSAALIQAQDQDLDSE